MKRLILFWGLVLVQAIYAQDITNTLATTGKFVIKDATNTFLSLQQNSGKLGLGGVLTPRAQVEVGGLNGLAVTGTVNSGDALALGAGCRMQWYPRKGAFRVGAAETTWWDDNGSATPNLALYSIAMGYFPRAIGVASTAIGANCWSAGSYSLSLGSYCRATADHSVAIGTQVFATGPYSIAIGAGADTNGKDGSMVIGDNTDYQTAYASNNNQLTMRFSGGYRLWSSYPDSVAGVYMRHGQSGWSNYCDRNKKENFEPVDGEQLLGNIRNIPVTKWNYKKTDPSDKYIGPMAQDFYAAFHLNGTDSLGINSICMDGVNFAGVQALEKRTSLMLNRIEKLEKQNTELANENKNLKEQISFINDVKNNLTELRKLKQELSEKLELLNALNGTEKPNGRNLITNVKQNISGK